MPLAPLFSFLTNLLEITIKISSMTQYTRRFKAEGDSGIGSWMGIMEVIAMIAIPLNISIILFTRMPSNKFGSLEDYDTVPLSEKPALIQYLTTEDNQTWSYSNIILLVFLIEHVLIIVKIALAAIIPDVPSEVNRAESKREKIEELA